MTPRANRELLEAGKENARASWVQLIYITPDTEALEKLAGTRRMDATAIVEYFQPLMGWLEERNRGRRCGW